MIHKPIFGSLICLSIVIMVLFAQNLKSTPAWVGKDTSVFTTHKLPSNLEQRPSIANGHIGTVVKSDSIHMNGLYNGVSNKSPSHRAVIPATAVVDVLAIHQSNHWNSSFSLDVERGFYKESHCSGGVTVDQYLYAHRTIPSLLVTELHVTRSDTEDPVEVLLKVKQWGTSPDISFQQKPLPAGLEGNMTYYYGKTLVPETNMSDHTEVHVLFDYIPSKLSLAGRDSNQTLVYLASIHAHLEMAVKDWRRGLEALKKGDLLESHQTAWLDTWKEGRVSVCGNDKLSRMLYGVQYYMLSSIPLKNDPTWPFIGLNPTGLPWGSDTYWGHVFWDQETWMYPGVLMIHEPLARILLDTRKRTMSAAAQHAVNTGYRGLRYPWESAFTGVEVTPDEDCANNEIHVNGDVFLAILQYWQATHSKEFLTDEGFGDIILGLADFWISRVHYDKQSGLYKINGVMPPDEYNNNVNNSVYTNTLASMTLHTASQVAPLLNKSGDKYEQYAKKVYIPFDEEQQFHPEFDGYKPGTTVKQADVVLLNFPLNYVKSEEVIANDLKMYSEVTSDKGPAMTWGMFAIGWLQLGRPDLAAANLEKMYDNVNGPFEVWSEVSGGRGVAHFITGMGGFLQTFLFGYGGLRITSDRLLLNPTLPPKCDSLVFTGVDYLYSSLDIIIHHDNSSVELTKHSSQAPALGLSYHDVTFDLVVDKKVTFPTGKAVIKKVDVD